MRFNMWSQSCLCFIVVGFCVFNVALSVMFMYCLFFEDYLYFLVGTTMLWSDDGCWVFVS
ncbi:hypothetical protein HanRHA438_Chr02g0094341 [Helianthus annuus]|nr:hypothetical protein HanRHA438_Chr02g0094341 [Helianthus annuus]